MLNWRKGEFQTKSSVYCTLRPTEPKEGQMEQQMAKLHKALASSSPVGIYVVQNRKFQFANPQFQKYTEFSEDELLGMDSLGIVYPRHLP